MKVWFFYGFLHSEMSETLTEHVLCRWCIQAGVVLARGLPNGTSQGAVGPQAARVCEWQSLYKPLLTCYTFL